MLRPEGAIVFKKHCWPEGTSWVDFMNTAIWNVVCQNLPMGVREGILKTYIWEDTVLGTRTPE